VQPQDKVADVGVGFLRRLHDAPEIGPRRRGLSGGQHRFDGLGLHVEVAQHLPQPVVQLAAHTLALLKGCQRALLFDERRLRLPWFPA